MKWLHFWVVLSNISGIFTQNLGEDSNFDEHMFQRGWFNDPRARDLSFKENYEETSDLLNKCLCRVVSYSKDYFVLFADLHKKQCPCFHNIWYDMYT